MVDSQCKKQKRTYLQAVFQKKKNKIKETIAPSKTQKNYFSFRNSMLTTLFSRNKLLVFENLHPYK